MTPASQGKCPQSLEPWVRRAIHEPHGKGLMIQRFLTPAGGPSHHVTGQGAPWQERDADRSGISTERWGMGRGKQGGDCPARRPPGGGGRACSQHSALISKRLVVPVS